MNEVATKLFYLLVAFAYKKDYELRGSARLFRLIDNLITLLGSNYTVPSEWVCPFRVLFAQPSSNNFAVKL
jgi:hypothetical protein